MTQKDRAIKIYQILSKAYPGTRTALNFHTPLEILVATILSAQCTDKRVNIVTKSLFKKYRTVKDYANAKPKKIESEIRSTGFYKNKTKNIINAAKMIQTDHNAKVPKTMEELIKLPGVARKTANIVLFSGFGKIEGIAVDTHVRRLSQRLGLSKADDPVKIEKDLMDLFVRKNWGIISHLLIQLGRNICVARKPKCSQCPLTSICPKKGLQ